MKAFKNIISVRRGSVPDCPGVRGNVLRTIVGIAPVAAVGLPSESYAAIFSGVSGLRQVQAAHDPAGGELVLTGPSDIEFAS